MEELYVKSGLAIDPSSLHPGVIEVSSADHLQTRFFAPDTPRQDPRRQNVFGRLYRDSETRKKVKAGKTVQTVGAGGKKATGPKIEDVLLRKYEESQMKMKKLKAKWEEVIMKEVYQTPKINEYSKLLAEQRQGYGMHSRCYIHDHFRSPPRDHIPTPQHTKPQVFLDPSLLTSRLDKYSDLLTPEEPPSQVSPPVEEVKEEPPERFEKAIQTQTNLVQPKVKTWQSLRLLSSDASEPVEMPESGGFSTTRSVVADATVPRDLALEYQKMVQRHIALTKARLT